ncbi:hypothetical protein CMI46_01790 [Candidatus Pacearchaeota archaeon]|nr:hypothetical protein [Candidatus Pacearchaeota archaeon]|tara:strand:+ start:134 stop:373 length:240 start_codon:yes stop_codon:yes gene_type:complete
MVINETILLELAQQFPDLESNVNGLIRILQVVGGIIGVYIILWTVNFIYSIRRTILIKKAMKRLEVLENKIDKLAKKVK